MYNNEFRKLEAIKANLFTTTTKPFQLYLSLCTALTTPHIFTYNQFVSKLRDHLRGMGLKNTGKSLSLTQATRFIKEEPAFPVNWVHGYLKAIFLRRLQFV